MQSLKFNGDITLDEVFNQHRILIYNNVLDAIQKNYKDPAIEEIKIVTITLNNIEYSINLSRSKFVSGLENAISFYEAAEEYEKCQSCVDIINDLNKKKREKKLTN
jgi:hypothetical protein